MELENHRWTLKLVGEHSVRKRIFTSSQRVSSKITRCPPTLSFSALLPLLNHALLKNAQSSLEDPSSANLTLLQFGETGRLVSGTLLENTS